MRLRRRMLVVAVLVGCGPSIDVVADASSTTGEPGGGSSTSTGGAASSDTLTPTSTGTAAQTDAASSSGCVGDGTGGTASSCDASAQDCPVGSKCVVVQPDDDPERKTLCVPVDCDGKPAGAACTRDEQTGIDDCSVSTFCDTPYPSDGTGYCIEFCVDLPGEFACADPATVCVGSASEGPHGCVPICDPLADECSPGQACMPAYPGTQATFGCYPAASGQTAGTGEPCYGPTQGCPHAGCYQCAPGFACSAPIDYGPGCEIDGTGCCTEYCELGGAPCSNPLHVCAPLFTGDAGDNADVGLCGLPADFDWCDGSIVPPPGFCPPPDADPNFPWCSSLDDSACPGDVVHLGGGQCWCVDPCASVDECPAPEAAAALPSCEPSVGCTLLCDDDGDCPAHMDCFFSDGALRCFWLPDS